MRHFKIIAASLVFLTLMSSCEDIFEEDDEKAPAQYFEADVNGKEFSGLVNDDACGNVIFNYFPEAVADLSPGFMQMGAENCSNESSLTFTFQRVNEEYQGRSSLEYLEFAESFKPSFRSDNGLIYNRFVEGTWKVDQFDISTKKERGRISGTFEMWLIDNLNTDTLHLSNGRFGFNIPRLRD